MVIHPTASNRAVVGTVLVASLVFSSFVRLRLRELPLERDDGEYAYAGQLILKGIPPYRLAYNMKLPGTYLAYAGLMALFGESAAGIHVGLLLVNLLTILLIFFLGRDLFESTAGAAAAVVYSVSSVSATVFGMAAHATHFVALFGVAGTWLLWKAIGRGSARTLFAAGLLLGTAFVMKQQGLFLPAFGAVAVVGHFGRSQPFSAGRLLTLMAVFMAGTVVPFSATCLWLWVAGVFDRFWLWTFDYARQYVVEQTLEQGAAMFWHQIRASAAANWPFWVAAILGAAGLALGSGGRERNRFVYAFFFGSFLCVCPGLYFREHYFIVLLPAIALLAGAGCNAVARFIGRAMAPGGLFHRQQPSKRRSASNPDSVGKSRRGVGRPAGGHRFPLDGIPARRERAFPADAVAAAILVVAVACAIWPQRGVFFFWTPGETCRAVYGANPFVESVPIADYLRSHSTPDDRVAVVGSEPQIYFLSRRTSATGYIYTYPLMEPQPFARRMQEDMAREIEASRPALVVLVNVPASWLAKPGSDPFIYEWAERFVRAEYEPAGLVDILSQERTEYHWGREAAGARPRSPIHVWILRRKSES
ncbi:MAG TPA: glycosyltransferase family 39 protein [Pirellulales bacterium]|nr:glycosyltransferase family 39 protein [Pirellulales bacterium]